MPHLVKEHLEILQNELQDVAGEGEVSGSLLKLLALWPDLGWAEDSGQWMDM